MKKQRRPAISALLHQIVGFVCTASAIFIGNWLFKSPSTILTLLLGTGTVAAVLSWKSKQPVWWIPIHLFFPLAVLIASYANIGSWWYLGGLILCIGLFGSIYKTRVPYYPSRKASWEGLAAIDTLQRDNLNIIDIGCGMGGCAIYLQRKNRTWRVTGIEMALIPLIVCKLRCLGKEATPSWILGDYNKLDFSTFDVLFAYLSPAAMFDLEKKLTSELKADAIFVSLEFRLPNWDVHKEIPTDAGTLYIYRRA